MLLGRMLQLRTEDGETKPTTVDSASCEGHAWFSQYEPRGAGGGEWEKLSGTTPDQA